MVDVSEEEEENVEQKNQLMRMKKTGMKTGMAMVTLQRKSNGKRLMSKGTKKCAKMCTPGKTRLHWNLSKYSTTLFRKKECDEFVQQIIYDYYGVDDDYDCNKFFNGDCGFK